MSAVAARVRSAWYPILLYIAIHTPCVRCGRVTFFYGRCHHRAFLFLALGLSLSLSLLCVSVSLSLSESLTVLSVFLVSLSFCVPLPSV